MTDERLRQAFLALCKDKDLHIEKDINGVLFGTLTGEQIFEVFKIGQLTCAFCGKVSVNELRHKYHMVCYCEAFQHTN